MSDYLYTTEALILSNIIADENYREKVLPHLKAEYFDHNSPSQVLFGLISEHLKTFNAPPTKDTLHIDLNNCSSVNEQQVKETRELIDRLPNEKTPTFDWLVVRTQKWCQQMAMHKAIIKAINIAEDERKHNIGNLTTIPQLLQRGFVQAWLPLLNDGKYRQWQNRGCPVPCCLGRHRHQPRHS
jgi:hypothetical protein